MDPTVPAAPAHDCGVITAPGLPPAGPESQIANRRGLDVARAQSTQWASVPCPAALPGPGGQDAGTGGARRRSFMWWTGLPGLDAPVQAAARKIADRAVAAAAAARAVPLDIEQGGHGTSRSQSLAKSFARWLAEADDADAWIRRLALCVTCEYVTPYSTASHVLNAAKWLYHDLSGRGIYP